MFRPLPEAIPAFFNFMWFKGFGKFHHIFYKSMSSKIINAVSYRAAS
jgi:hypothetical protein